MTTHQKDDCPCGSGKRYKHCHMAADQAKKRRLLGGGIGVVAALVLGVAAWGAIQQWQAGRQAGPGAATDSLAPAGGAGSDVAGVPAPAPSGAFGTVVPGRNAQAPIPASPGGAIVANPGASQALAPGEKATPWQYDVARNRHYDPRPGHQHWHNGPPPADTSKAVGTPSVVTVEGGTAKVSTTTTQVKSTGTEALAPGENPAPWEYDAARDRHFDPRDSHRHWHAGPPPAPSARGN